VQGDTGPDDRQLGFSKGVHDYYAHYADNADAKIAALFAVNLAIAGLLIGDRPDGCVSEVLVWLAVGLHAAAGGLLGYGIYPRVTGPGVDVLFWEKVRQYDTRQEYVRNVLKLSPEAVERTYAENNYFVADVLRHKFNAIRFALWFTAVALVLGALAMLLD
jgi:hypothetical protein